MRDAGAMVPPQVLRYRLERIQVFPVKDAPGRRLNQGTVTACGVIGDRPKKRALLVTSSEDMMNDEPRSNLVVDVPSDTLARATGHEMHIGDVVVRLGRQPSECPGLYAEVVRTGDVLVGDVVVID